LAGVDALAGLVGGNLRPWREFAPGGRASQRCEDGVKIAIGMRPYAGPWGGGNRFVTALSEALSALGHDVVFELGDRDIDILLIMDPRKRSPNVTFTAGGALHYVTARNPNAIVVHRINECDERKGERFINDRLVRANYVADVTVFVGEWLSRLPVWQRHLREPWYVIRNGADPRLFNAAGFVPWSGSEPLRLVTHHWGYHKFKGFDVYAAIDDLLDDEAWSLRLAFTYVGNLPKGFSFRNVRHLAALNGEPLADELRSHHGYVTGSIGEPGGNHQHEAALCGLPLIYRNSGCMPEYCDGFGISFDGPGDFVPAFERLCEKYPSLVSAMAYYPHTAGRMTDDWIGLFEKLDQQRADLVYARRLWRNPAAALKSFWAL
jgi:hypothetical protein